MCEIVPVELHLKLLLKKENETEDDQLNINSTNFRNQSNVINCVMPAWYDDKKFKRGQKYYKDHRFSMFAAKLSGLVAVLAIPSILKILYFTNMSSTSYTAYKRYVATILHMLSWYRSDFDPGSKAWKSLINVRNRHFQASKRSEKSGCGAISHRDMALTQFGFIGFALARGEYLGIDIKDREGVEGFVHFWRVIGWLLGIDDKYNLCRENVDETIYLCDKLIQNYFSKAVRSEDSKFIEMYRALLDAMWCINPIIYINTFMIFLFKITSKKHYLKSKKGKGQVCNEKNKSMIKTNDNLTSKTNDNLTSKTNDNLTNKTNDNLTNKTNDNLTYKTNEQINNSDEITKEIGNEQNNNEIQTPQLELTNFKKIVIRSQINILGNLYKNYFFRMFFNWNLDVELFLMEYFPFLAYFLYGFNVHVKIF